MFGGSKMTINRIRITNQKEVEDWVLINLSVSTSPNGLPITQAWFNVPKNLEPDTTNFYEIIDCMIKQGVIERVPYFRNNVRITENGKIDLEKRMKYLRKKDKRGYIELISYSPIFELRERVTIIEKFLFYIILIGAFWLLFNLGVTNGNSYLILISSLVIAILTILLSFYIANLVDFAGKGSKQKIIRFLFSLLDKHGRKGFYLLFLVILVALFYLINRYLGISWANIIAGILIGIISTIILAIVPIMSKYDAFLTKIKNKLSKKR